MPAYTGSFMKPSNLQSKNCIAGRIAGAVFPLLVFAGLLGFGLFRIQFGLDLTDEGLHVSSAYRYLLGDDPIRGAWTNNPSRAELFLWFFFRLFPGASLYHIRILGVATQMTCLAALFILFRRYAPSYIVALACASSAFICYGLYTPAYNLLGQFFFVLSTVLWVSACITRRGRTGLAKAICGGLFYFMGVIAYPPLASLLLLPVLACFLISLGRIRCDSAMQTAVYRATCAFVFSAFFAGALGALASLLATGFPAAIEALVTLLPRIRAYTVHAATGFYLMPWQMIGLLPTMLASMMSLVLACLVFPVHRTPRDLLLMATFIVGVIAVLGWLDVSAAEDMAWNKWPVTHWLLSLSLALPLVDPTLKWFYGRSISVAPRASEWGFVRSTVLFAGICYFLVQSACSTNGILNGRYAIPVLFVLGITSLYRTLNVETNNNDRVERAFGIRRASLVGILLVATSLNLYENFTDVYFSPPVDELTATFSLDNLKGIRAAPVLVSELETLISFLRRRVRRGEVLLMDGDFPMIFYLTDTRPALEKTWCPWWWGHQSSERTNMITYMIDNRRESHYCVCYFFRAPPNEEDPVLKYVKDHYVPILKVGFFYVFERVS
jgi:hypothetical protein